MPRKNKVGIGPILGRDDLMSRLRYEPATGDFFWRVHAGRCRPNEKAGCSCSNGCLRVRVQDREYLLHRLAWLFVHGEWPVAFIDHVNGDKADNAIANLREATNSQNQANRRRPTRNTSGLKGVCRSPTKDKWVAYINVKGRRRNLGTYEWHWQAKEAYVAAHLEAFGAHSSPYYDGEPRLG